MHRVARLFKKYKKRKHHLNYSVKQQPCETSKCLIHTFFFSPLLQFLLLIDFEKLDTRGISFLFFFFIFFFFLFFLKEIIHHFPPSIMQRVKCNRDVFLWWILQKNTIKRARWKTDTRHICINFSSWYFIRLFISQSSSSTMSCILLNSITLIEFFEFAFL